MSASAKKARPGYERMSGEEFLKRPEAGGKRREQEQQHHGPNGSAEPGGNAQEEAKQKSRAKYLAWSDLAGKTPPPRQWLWYPHIPRGVVTYLHGFGGVGKSLLAQQIGTAAAFARDLFGSVAHAERVLGWFGEDDHDELWRRQEAINEILGIRNMAELEGEIFWRPCPGDDITFFSAVAEDKFTTTPKFEEWLKEVETIRPGLSILDSATQVAAVPENNRPLVTRSIQELTKPAIKYNMAIILIGHDNRQGDYSGSSAWENRSRSRLHMKITKDKDGGEDGIKLARPKANYSARDDGLPLEWRAGAFHCTTETTETPAARLDRKVREGAAEQAFLDALDRLIAQQRHTSASKSAQNYAPKLMAEAGVIPGDFAKVELERAMQRLFAAGRIVASQRLWQRDNRHWVHGVARPERPPEAL